MFLRITLFPVLVNEDDRREDMAHGQECALAPAVCA